MLNYNAAETRLVKVSFHSNFRSAGSRSPTKKEHDLVMSIVNGTMEEIQAIIDGTTTTTYASASNVIDGTSSVIDGTSSSVKLFDN